MEVHHHPQVEKKNFKEYFLEFLMIFLAVTMGFFAENIREYFAEKKNAKEYLEFFEKKENDDLKKISRLEFRARRVINVPLQTSAYTQIVNSGGLKYIPGKMLKDSMAKYQGLIQGYIKYNDLLFQQRSLLLPTIASIEDDHDSSVAG